jgi:hypothetical protein
LKSVEGYLSPHLAFYIDFDWKEVFADNPNAKVLPNNTLVIENAKPEDLQKLLELDGFRNYLYKIQVDDLVYEMNRLTQGYGSGQLSWKELMEEKQMPQKKLVVSRVDCLNCK